MRISRMCSTSPGPLIIVTSMVLAYWQSECSIGVSACISHTTEEDERQKCVDQGRRETERHTQRAVTRAAVSAVSALEGPRRHPQTTFGSFEGDTRFENAKRTRFTTYSGICVIMIA